jgi:deoxyribonuclease V
MDYNTLETIELATHCMQVPFPYIPGLFCDGHGWAHPRRFGLACHLGVILDKPTPGCGKTRLLGHFEEPGQERGAMSALFDDNKYIGRKADQYAREALLSYKKES